MKPLRRLAILGDLNASHTHGFLPGIRDRLAGTEGVETQFLALHGDHLPKLPPRLISEMDAWILIATQTDAFSKLYPSLRGKIYELGSGYPESGFPGVDMDHGAVGRLAARHLMERGYGRFAALGTRDSWSRLRIEAFTKALGVLDKPVATELFPSSEISFNWSGGLSRKAKAWVRDVFQKNPGPLGFFAVSDNPAAGVFQLAEGLKVPIPLRLGILGVNNDPMSAIQSGGKLSSIRLPQYRAGWRVVDLVLSGSKKLERMTPLDIVVRSSTGGFVTEDPVVRRAQEWVARLPGTRIKVELLCADLGLTRMTLNRRFRSALGKSFQTYLQEQRLDLARKSLAAGGHTVASAARMAGWEAPRSFIQVHRKFFGRTPGAELLG